MTQPFSRVVPTLVLALVATYASGRADAQTVASKTQANVSALASEKAEGRLAGAGGEKFASDYIVGE